MQEDRVYVASRFRLYGEVFVIGLYGARRHAGYRAQKESRYRVYHERSKRHVEGALSHFPPFLPITVKQARFLARESLRELVQDATLRHVRARIRLVERTQRPARHEPRLAREKYLRLGQKRSVFKRRYRAFSRGERVWQPHFQGYPVFIGGDGQPHRYQP